jgi:hypothetical protein
MPRVVPNNAVHSDEVMRVEAKVQYSGKDCRQKYFSRYR